MSVRRSLSMAALIGAGGLLASLCACAPPPPPPPAVLMLSIAAGPDQNPDATGHAAPVAVHLFQLATTAKFERADIFALIEREQATLGTDGLASEEFVLAPGETRTVTRELKKDTQAVGVAVLFRDIDHATWRAMAPVSNTGPQKLLLKTQGITASLSPASAPPALAP